MLTSILDVDLAIANASPGGLKRIEDIISIHGSVVIVKREHNTVKMTYGQHEQEFIPETGDSNHEIDIISCVRAVMHSGRLGRLALRVYSFDASKMGERSIEFEVHGMRGINEGAHVEQYVQTGHNLLALLLEILEWIVDERGLTAQELRARCFA